MPKTPINRKFIVLINPISGTRSKADLGKKIVAEANARQFEAIVLPTVASGDYQFVAQKISEEGFTDVVICGGDGSVNQVVNSLHETGVNFGVIPMGSGNGLANTAGIPKATDKAISLLFTGKARYIDAFQVNDQFACMLCGLGFDAQVAHDFARQPGRGLLTYTQQTLKNFFTAAPYRFELLVNDQVIQTEAFFISIANSNQFGNNFTIAPKASLSDGLLDIVIVTQQHKLSVLYQTLRQIRGKNQLQTATIDEKKKGVLYFQAESLVLENHSGAPLHIDGDPAETPERLEITIREKCFRLYQP